jgi:hypothetical protein
MSQKKPYKEQFLTAEKAGELLDLNPRTIREWASEPENGIARNKNRNYGLVSLLLLAISRKRKQAEEVDPKVQLLLAQADYNRVLAEIRSLERDRMIDKSVDAEEASQVWTDHQDKLQKRLNRLSDELPERLADQLPSAIADNLSQEQKQELLERWREKICTELEQVWE